MFYSGILKHMHIQKACIRIFESISLKFKKKIDINTTEAHLGLLSDWSPVLTMQFLNP